ncbi:unnamed protein product, partial [Staurois parvus]
MAESGDESQQQWEAVQGPMTHSGPGSSKRRRWYRGPWQSGEARQQREQTTEAHGAGWRWRQQYSEAIHRPRFKTGTQQREQTTKTHMAEDGSGSSMRRRYRGPWHSVVMGATATGCQKVADRG